MCGISFIINYSPNKKISLHFVKEIFENLEARGTDASGVYWERKTAENTMLRRLIKAPCTATELWNKVQESTDPCDKNNLPYDWSEKKEAFYDKFRLDGTERLILLHTRNKTQGSEENNNNNMPIVSNDYVLIHNGILANDRPKSYQYRGEVDSEEILAYIDIEKTLKDAFEKIHGGMAIAFKHFDSDKLYIYRNTNPLDLMYFKKQKVLVGVSNRDYAEPLNGNKTLAGKLLTPTVQIEEVPSKEMYSIDLLTMKIKLEFKVDGNWKKEYDTTQREWLWTRED